jgi:2-keto-3-deoxy-L-rhamnonate aldolase RhmA
LSNPIKEKLAAGEVSIGSWIQLPVPGIAEIMAGADFDWIAVDCEHGAVGIADLANTFRGMYGRRPLPLARVTDNSPLAIRRPLDAGAAGVFVPLVHTAEDARQAVSAARYPAAGIRGYAFCRANDYGRSFDEYARTANEDLLVIVMIESRTGVEQIDSILEVDGVDGVFIGPYDMSGSYGVVGKVDDPRVREGCVRVVEACRRAGKAAGIHLVRPTPASIDEALRTGYTLIALGMDTVFLERASAEVAEIARDTIRSRRP